MYRNPPFESGFNITKAVFTQMFTLHGKTTLLIHLNRRKGNNGVGERGAEGGWSKAPQREVVKKKLDGLFLLK